MESEIHSHKKKSKSKHTKTSLVPKESNLDENEALVSSYVMELNDRYICEVNNHKHCFIKGDRHLLLNNFKISLWAKEIVCIFIITIIQFF